MIVFAGVGIAAGLVRKQKFTATTQLAVLHLPINAAGALNSLSTAGPVLADTYARAVKADGVIKPLSTEFRQSPHDLKDQLSAVGIPQSPVFTISATTRNAKASVALTNAAATQLLAYLKSTNSYDPDSARIFKELAAAEDTLAAATQQKNQTQADINNKHFGLKGAAAQPTSSERDKLGKAAAAIAQAQDQVSALKQSYQSVVQNVSNTQFVSQVTTATTATGDRTKKLELYGFAGLAIGLALGVIAAMLRAAFSRRRRLA